MLTRVRMKDLGRHQLWGGCDALSTVNAVFSSRFVQFLHAF